MLRGDVVVRTPQGERELGPWDCAAFLSGAGGAHQIRNAGDETARVVFFATRSDPDVRVYPDEGAVRVVANGEALL